MTVVSVAGTRHRRWLGALILVSSCLFAARAQACIWAPGGAGHAGPGLLVVTLPAALAVPPDAAGVGTVLWSTEGWRWAPTGELRLCLPGGVRASLASSIGPLVGGSPVVRRTNVPGIGIAVFWCRIGRCPDNPLQLNVTDGQTWGEMGSLSMRYGFGSHDPFTHFWIYLVKTGEITPGVLQLPGTSTVYYQDGRMPVSRLTFTGRTQVTAPTCMLDPGSARIAVPLPAVARGDFTDGALLAAPDKARMFGIRLACDAGVSVSYRIDGTHASSGQDVLANDRGAGLATGVGVKLFQGELDSSVAMPLGRRVHFADTTQDGQPLHIPLTARYYRTAPTADAMTAGAVSISAIFTLSYE